MFHSERHQPSHLPLTRQGASMNSKSLELPLFCAATILAGSLLGCSGDNGQIDANASVRVEFPEAVASAVEFPILLTISLGPEGREENRGSQSAQRAVVL